jgi:O-antigen ligase
LLLLFSRALADITIVLVSLVFLVRSFRQQEWTWLRYSWVRLALLFWAYLLFVNLPTSQLPQESFKAVLAFIRWPLFAAALAYWLIAKRRQQWLLLKSLSITALFVVLDTSWQYVFDVDWFGIERFSEERLTGPFRNPVPGTLMLRLWFIGLFVVLFWHWLQTKPQRQIMAIPFMLFVAVGFTFITGERMALLLLMVGIAIVVMALIVEFSQYRRELAMSIGTILLAVVMVTVADPVMMQRSILSIGEKLSDFTESDYGQVFNAAWQVWQTHFWFGVGLDNYQLVCDQMGMLKAAKMQCTHPHNLYLELGTETGMVGMTLFVVLLLALYREALSQAVHARAWLHMSLSAAVLTVSFWPLSGGISLLSNWVAALVWLGVGWVLAVSGAPLQVQSQRKVDPAD